MKQIIYESIVQIIMMYGAECWTINNWRSKITLTEIEYWRPYCEVIKTGRLKNEEIVRRIDIEEETIQKITIVRVCLKNR